MKTPERREVLIDIHDAVRLYNEGGIMKDIALQSFTEDEILDVITVKDDAYYASILNKFAENYPIGSIAYDTDYRLMVITSKPYYADNIVNGCYVVAFNAKRIVGNYVLQGHTTYIMQDGTEDDCLYVKEEHNIWFRKGIISSYGHKIQPFDYEGYKAKVISWWKERKSMHDSLIRDAKKSIERNTKYSNECLRIIDNYDETFNSIIEYAKKIAMA